MEFSKLREDVANLLREELPSVTMAAIFWLSLFFLFDLINGFQVSAGTSVPNFMSTFVSESIDVESKFLEMLMLGGFCLILVILKVKSLALRVSSDIARVVYWIGFCLFSFAAIFGDIVNRNKPHTRLEMILVGLFLVIFGLSIVFGVHYAVKTRHLWRLRRRAIGFVRGRIGRF